jgi:putrescine transport system permease protein
VAARLLPGPVRDRPEAQLLRDGGGAAALPALAEWLDDAGQVFVQFRLNLSNYLLLVQDSLYVRAYLNSVRIAAIATALTLLVGFPMAYAMARAPERWRPTLLMLVILPFWTSFLIRVYAWIGILKNEGC